MQSTDAKLWLDPSTVVLSSKGRLYVFNRRGLTKIEADQIDEVHERLKRYLDGTCEESELIAAVGTGKRSVLEKYFTVLTQAGALLRGDAGSGNPSLTVKEADDRQATHSLIVTPDGKRVYVSLDGADPVTDTRDFDARLSFVTPDEMSAQWRHAWRARPEGPHLLYVIEDRQPGLPLSETEIDARKRYAAWLLGCSRPDSWPGRRIRLYTLDRASLSLTLRFQIALDDRPGDRKATSELIEVTDHEQIPLVVAQTAVPYDRNSVSGYGLDYGVLYQELEREFMVRTTLSGETDSERAAYITEVRDRESNRTKLRRTRVDPKEAATWPVAGSLLHLRVRALEGFWQAHPESCGQVSGREIDLLEMSAKHSQVAYLTDVLRTRLSTLPAKMTTASCGLYTCRSGKHQACSLVEARAIRDVLLAVTREKFYRESLGDMKAGHECDFADFLSEEELRQLIRRQEAILDERGITGKFTLRHVQRCGLSAWIGKLANGS